MSDGFDLIFSYTRKQAIEDGVLIDVTEMAKEAGFKWPVAITDTVWNQHIVPDVASAQEVQSIEGRLWDVLNVLRFRALTGGTEVLFKVIFIEKGVIDMEIELKAVCGPGDEGEPVITIMLPGED